MVVVRQCARENGDVNCASVSIAAREGANRARQNSEAVERAVRGGTEGCWGGKGWVPLVQPQRGALQDTEGIPKEAEGPPGWDP